MAIAYGTGRWLTKEEYAKIRYKAKKMGATEVCLSAIAHHVKFKYASVSFSFKPLKYQVNLHSLDFFEGLFKDKAEADAIKAEMDLSLEFIEFLKEFNKTIK